MGSLHRAVGNQAVQSLVERGVLDPPDSAAEREAEAVARQANRSVAEDMRTSTSSSNGGSPTVARRSADRHGSSVDPGEELRRRIDDASGTGESLPESERSYFGSRFHRSFDDVTIHRDADADDLTDSLDAAAFTAGTDVFFSSGEYEPDTARGRSLLAHELTHVVQQDGTQGSAARAIQRQQSGFNAWDGTGTASAGTESAAAGAETTAPENDQADGYTFFLGWAEEAPDELTKPIRQRHDSFEPDVSTYGELEDLLNTTFWYIIGLMNAVPNDSSIYDDLDSGRADVVEFRGEVHDIVEGFIESGHVDPDISIGQNHELEMREVVDDVRGLHHRSMDAIAAEELAEEYAAARNRAIDARNQVQELSEATLAATSQAFHEDETSVLSEIQGDAAHIVNLADAFAGFVDEIDDHYRQLSRAAATGEGFPGSSTLQVPFDDLLSKVNFAMGAFGTLQSLLDLGDGENYLEEVHNGLSVVTNTFGTAGTAADIAAGALSGGQAGLAPHIGAYATYLGVMTNKVMTMTEELLSEYGTRNLEAQIAMNSDVIYVGPEQPGGDDAARLFYRLVEANYASDWREIGGLEQGVRDYISNKAEAFEAGTGDDTFVDEGFVGDSLESSAAIKQWLHRNAEDIWILVYGTLPIPDTAPPELVVHGPGYQVGN